MYQLKMLAVSVSTMLQINFLGKGYCCYILGLKNRDWDPVQYLGYCTVCNSININHRFNLTLINLTPRIRDPGDPRDSLLPFPSLFFSLHSSVCPNFRKKHSLSLLQSYPWCFSGTPMAKSPSLLLAIESHITTISSSFRYDPLLS